MYVEDGRKILRQVVIVLQINVKGRSIAKNVIKKVYRTVDGVEIEVLIVRGHLHVLHINKILIGHIV